MKPIIHTNTSQAPKVWVNTFYVGHSPACDISAIKKQKAYFLDYCSESLKATGGTVAFDEASKEQFKKNMLEKYPGYGCQFMVGLAAEKVASDSEKHRNSKSSSGI